MTPIFEEREPLIDSSDEGQCDTPHMETWTVRSKAFGEKPQTQYEGFAIGHSIDTYRRKKSGRMNSKQVDYKFIKHHIERRALLSPSKSESITQADDSTRNFAPGRRNVKRSNRRLQGINDGIENEDAVLDLLDEYSYKLDIEKEIRR
ncbi:Tigger transposable element-derived protein 6 [Ascosphaera pollenicola]|nr:Tigger transposable element-derived protein 6 [Ascosphaera pollenicola]